MAPFLAPRLRRTGGPLSEGWGGQLACSSLPGVISSQADARPGLSGLPNAQDGGDAGVLWGVNQWTGLELEQICNNIQEEETVVTELDPVSDLP